MNPVEIAEAISELTTSIYRPEKFLAGFMAAYGAPNATLARIKAGEGKSSDFTGGILWRRWLHFEPSTKGTIAGDLDLIEASKKTAQAKVRYAIACDGREFGARDLKTGEVLHCEVADTSRTILATANATGGHIGRPSSTSEFIPDYLLGCRSPIFLTCSRT